MIHFSKMTRQDVMDYKEWAIDSYADDLFKTGSYSIDEAKETSLKEFSDLFKEGIVDDANHINNIYIDQVKIGFVWYRVIENDVVWICDFLVYDNHRNKGYAKASLAQLEEEAKKMKLTTIGLHVFGFNVEAISLYEKCGYIKHKESTEESIYMSKTLG